ncbi:alpha/beta hydrolase [Nocardia altamirensis]|uniref:alpha/beta hydrolase n=1 Tax=Nocardia altamirensis TaxID=472158 RepID=UPI000A01BE0A|nr:alpha/beta hydrolase [Nocardia altamirensis]
MVVTESGIASGAATPVDGSVPGWKRRRKRFEAGGRRLLKAGLVVWAMMIAAPVAIVLSPTLPAQAWWPALIATSYSLYLLIPAVLGIGFGVATWRRRWRWATAGVAVIAVMGAAAALVPWAAASRTAAGNGVTLSLSAYFGRGPQVGGPSRTEVFATLDGQPLKVDIWSAAGPAANPAVVFVHGGSWTTGGRDESPQQNQWFVEHGYTVFDIEYRLSPPPRWHQQTSDVKCAIGWVAQHSDRLGIDPADITVIGESAGANLALLAAYTVGTGAFPPSCPVPEHPVRAVISEYGPTDTAALTLDDHIATTVFGGSTDTALQAYRVTSPLSYVRPGLPATLLLHGRSDHFVNVAQTTELDTALTKVAVPHRSVLLPWTEHAYTLIWSSWSTQITRGVLDHFLAAHTR